MNIARLLNPSSDADLAELQPVHLVFAEPPLVSPRWSMQRHLAKRRRNIVDDAAEPKRPRWVHEESCTYTRPCAFPDRTLQPHDPCNESLSRVPSLAVRGSDWCADFLNTGFNPTGIFYRICGLRKGRWRKEEEAYAVELIHMVHANRIPLKFRQSLRSFLAEKLHSDEMRVLKKVGNSEAFAFARQRSATAEIEQPSIGYENEQTIEPLESLRRAFLKSVQLEVVIAMREHQALPKPSST
ncbi:DNA polymerase delta catalytic subunit [Achlya hypogyna]|uniref:DNA polymerase delta catalytic subunit n=1 Tax=Achlya hypogyna TaxID=1202772 RepID=A0A1V9YIG8_ACHHY|nr:DNA polymerase delta catalytic subunit [Achlya hypogyna]